MNFLNLDNMMGTIQGPAGAIRVAFYLCENVCVNHGWKFSKMNEWGGPGPVIQDSLTIVV